MTPLQRALITYEGNHALDGCPMGEIARLARETPVVRWDHGVAFFTMADIVAAGNHPGVISSNPVTHEAMGMGSKEPLIPLHLDGDAHRHTGACSIRCSHRSVLPFSRTTSGR
jgi:hypothetical protein